MHLREAVSQYLAARYAAGHSEIDIRSCASTLKVFCNFIQGTDIANLTPDHIRSFLAWRRESGKSRSTINQNLGRLRAFARWCIKAGYIQEAFTQGIEHKGSEVRDFQVPTPAALMAVARAATSRSELLTWRNIAAILTLMDTGVRRGELLAMNRRDIHYDPENNCGYMNVWQTKTSRGKIVFLSDVTMVHISEYLVRRTDNHEALWISEKGGRWSETGIRRLFETISKRTGLHVYPHLFRHLFATFMLLNDVPRSTVDLLGGWRDERSSRRYTAKAEALMAQKQHMRASPVVQISKAVDEPPTASPQPTRRARHP